MTDAELGRLNKELEIQIALGVAPEMYEVKVYRLNTLGEVFRSCVWVGVRALDGSHAMASVIYTEKEEDREFVNSADRLHHVKVIGPLNLSRSIKLYAPYPVRSFPGLTEYTHTVCQKNLKTPS